MKKVIAIICALVVGAGLHWICRGLAISYLDMLRETGGVVTATEIVGAKYVFPIVLPAFAAYLTYWICNDEKM